MTNNETLLYEALKRLIEAVNALRKGTYYDCEVKCGKQVDEALTNAKTFIELIEP